VADERPEEEQQVARREAAPAVLVAALADIVLAFVSAWRGWHLYQGSYWWVWLLLALPALAVFVVFLLGLGRLGVSSEHRRKVAIMLLGAVAFANLAGIALVIVSLLNGGGNMTGGQLLASAVVVLLVNIITFGLIFWELDCGGPVRRLSSDRARPDFQFPQDDNPQLAAPGWKPGLGDYLYIAVTNSIAFSPTDSMPLTKHAKLFMSCEAVIAASTLLIVAARAVNVLQG
jgi:hypothetical protein